VLSAGTNTTVDTATAGQIKINASFPSATSSVTGGVRLTNDLGGTATAPTVVATHLSAALPVNQGGTGQSGALTQGGIIAALTSSSMSSLSAGTSGYILKSQGAGSFPTWLQYLPIAQGGTNNPSLGVTAGGVYYGDGDSLAQTGASGTNGTTALVSGNAGAPSWAWTPRTYVYNSGTYLYSSTATTVVSFAVPASMRAMYSCLFRVGTTAGQTAVGPQYRVYSTGIASQTNLWTLFKQSVTSNYWEQTSDTSWTQACTSSCQNGTIRVDKLDGVANAAGADTNVYIQAFSNTASSYVYLYAPSYCNVTITN
jgi:hypothetical protein